MNPRVVGSILGVLIGMSFVIYLDRHEVPSQGSATKPPASASSTSVLASQEEDTAVLRKLADQAEEIARLGRAKAVDEARDLLRAPQTPHDPSRPELVRLRALSSRELKNEIETAVEEVESYTASGAYAPERHAELHQRINNLWDLRGLTETQNKWLAEAVKELNELVVQHAEEAMESGDEDEIIHAVTSLGQWAFRLNDDQEKRLVAAMEMAATRYAERHWGVQ